MFVLFAPDRRPEALLSVLKCTHGTVWFGDAGQQLVLHWSRERRLAPQHTQHIRIFNDPDRLHILSKLRAAERRLAIHGMRARLGGEKTPMATGQVVTQWRVLICDLEVVSVHQGRVTLSLEQPGRQLRLVMREAVRAMYVLGIDLAEVTLAYGGFEKLTVISIDPLPTLDESAAMALSDALKQAEQRWMHEQNGIDQEVKFGADCEFVLRRDNGKIVAADRFFSKEGTVGCDGIRLRDRFVYPLVEIRPQASRNPNDLYKHIHRALQSAYRRVGDQPLTWEAGGQPVPGISIGGHVHISGVHLTGELLRTLDNYVGLPLVMIEREVDRLRRPRHGYLGDHRRKPHGGFEYRTPASWLVSPDIARAVLILVSLVIHARRKLLQRPLDRAALQQAFYSGSKQELQKDTIKIWRDLEALPEYESVRGALTGLRRMSLAGMEWEASTDMRESWRLHRTAGLLQTP